MIWILLRNKKIFDSVAGTTVEKIFAVNRQNLSWPCGLRQKSLLAASKRLPVAPLRAAHFSLRISDFCQQRNHMKLANSA